eukprot:scaffold637_cov118-Isochrysis_galbana.AAC.6
MALGSKVAYRVRGWVGLPLTHPHPSPLALAAWRGMCLEGPVHGKRPPRGCDGRDYAVIRRSTRLLHIIQLPRTKNEITLDRAENAGHRGTKEHCKSTEKMSLLND